MSTVKYVLLATSSVGGVIVCFWAVMMYYVERTAQPEAFSNIGEGFWWALITFTSVGYGDIYPITSLGKILTSCMLVIGIGVMALPSAIVSAAFINYIHDNKEFMIKRTLPDEVKSQKKKEHDHNNYCSHCGQVITDKKDNDIS